MSLRSQVLFESLAFSQHCNTHVIQQRLQLEVQVGTTLVEMWTSTKPPPAAGQALTSIHQPRLQNVLREK